MKPNKKILSHLTLAGFLASTATGAQLVTQITVDSHSTLSSNHDDGCGEGACGTEDGKKDEKDEKKDEKKNELE